MRRQPDKKSIGLFLIIGMVAFGLIFGQAIVRKLWPDTRYMAVLYFEESIGGLDVGSPVVFNGVEIGKVVKIELVGDAQNLTFQTPVYIQVKPLTKADTDIWDNFRIRKDSLDVLIQNGLRARLLTQSYLTGQLMVELSLMPQTEVQLHNYPRDIRQGIPEIPTVLSPGGELSRGIQDLPIKESFDRLDHILVQLDEMMPVLKRAGENLEKVTAVVAPRTGDTLSNINESFYQFSDAMRTVRNLADYLERYPESLLKGKED